MSGTDKGFLVINADDWGADRQTTDRIWDCAIKRRISSVSAMVFMDDSERAAELSRDAGITSGLHLNFTTPFSARRCPPVLLEEQRKITVWLRRTRFARALYHPGLHRSFEYVVAAQLEEYCRLYGAAPERLDGHHHMHLCPNVLFARLLPAGTTVRRNFTFEAGEKNILNRLYRSISDRMLARRHRVTDFFYSLAPIVPLARVQKILALARAFKVEVETHPAVPEEYQFLTGEEMQRLIQDVRMELPQQSGKSSISLA